MAQILIHMGLDDEERGNFHMTNEIIYKIMTNIDSHDCGDIMNIRTGEVIDYEDLKNIFNTLETLSEDTEWLFVE